MTDRRYVVVTPARDEARHIGATIRSMKAQARPPAKWIIVDDGSSDETAAIVRSAARDWPVVELIQRTDRGHRRAGGGVVEAVMEGVAAIDTEWDYLVKLDADLTFGPEYFSTCLDAFAFDPTLGIVGGTVWNVARDGTRTAESHPDFHVRGATKIYRRRCWEDIGGLEPVPGWDTIDEITANKRNWRTRTIDAPIDQLRPTGQAAGQWNNWVKNGRAAYLSGYDPVFVTARAISRVPRSPHVAAPVGLMWGYLRSAARREPKSVDRSLQRYVRQQQRRRLTGRETIWR